jgi:AhpD family alkylhydroperoxidase
MNSHLYRTFRSCRPIGSLDPENPSLEEISVDSRLLDLVRLRVAQIYECSLCTDYHTESLREHGEPHQRIQGVQTWRKSALFDEREQAALALADSLASEPSGPIPDEVVHRARHYYNDAEILQLVLAIFAASDCNYQAQHYPKEAIHRITATGARQKDRSPGE